MSSVSMDSGFNIQEAMNTIMAGIKEKENELKTEIDKLEGAEISDTQMLNLQFQMNQYNTLLESASTITKALTDQAKQMAQRSN